MLSHLAWLEVRCALMITHAWAAASGLAERFWVRRVPAQHLWGARSRALRSSFGRELSLSALLRRHKSHPGFSYTPNILLSHSDPVTPGLFSGLGTVDVGKVPLGSWSFAITWHIRLQTYPVSFSPPGWRFWSLFLRFLSCVPLVGAVFGALGRCSADRFALGLLLHSSLHCTSSSCI